MYQRIILTAEATELSQGMHFVKVKAKPTAMRDCLEYSRKLKIKDVGFLDLKVVNIQKFALVFLVSVSACFMALMLEVNLKPRPNLVEPM